jgi:hypothetical protein
MPNIEDSTRRGRPRGSLNKPPVPRLGYRIKELAAALGVSYGAMRRAIANGGVKATRFANNTIIISAEEAQRILKPRK